MQRPMSHKVANNLEFDDDGRYRINGQLCSFGAAVNYWHNYLEDPDLALDMLNAIRDHRLDQLNAGEREI
jgi:hypothetical protein